MGHQGRVQLTAARYGKNGSPVGFYYRLGFRSCDPSILNDEAIEKRLSEPSTGKHKYSDLKSIYMYLPEESIKIWQRKIADGKILKNKRKKSSEKL